MSDDRRQKRKEARFIQNESVWLQKALFALRKAEAAHEALRELRDEEAGAYAFRVGEREVPLEDLEETLAERVERLMQEARTMRRSLH